MIYQAAKRASKLIDNAFDIALKARRYFSSQPSLQSGGKKTKLKDRWIGVKFQVRRRREKKRSLDTLEPLLDP